MESKISSVFEMVMVVVASVSDSESPKVVESNDWAPVAEGSDNLVA